MQIQSMELVGLNGSGLATLVVDARPFKGETRAYAGDVSGGHLTVFDPNMGVWYRVTLRCDCDPPPERTGEVVVPTEFVAVSKLYSTVYLTSKRSHDLYSASFRDLRNLTSYVTPSVKVRRPVSLFAQGSVVRTGGPWIPWAGFPKLLYAYQYRTSIT